VEATKVKSAQLELETAQRSSSGGAEGGGSTSVAQHQLKEARDAVLQAYKFAVNKVGGLWNAGLLWGNYVKFTRTLPQDGVFNTSFAKDAQREAYQLGCTNAHSETDALWAAYSEFEKSSGSNKLSDVQLSKTGKLHSVASSVARHRKQLWGEIDAERLPWLCCESSSSTLSPSSSALTSLKKQSLAWRALVAYELSNPFSLEPSALEASVSLVFRAGLSGPLRDCPETWFEYASFQGLEKGGAGFDVLKQAMHTLPLSCTLVLATADSFELCGKVEEAGEVVSRFLKDLHEVAECGGVIAEFAAAQVACADWVDSGECSELPAVVRNPAESNSGVSTALFSAIDAVLLGGGLPQAFSASSCTTLPIPSPYNSESLSKAPSSVNPRNITSLLSKVVSTPQQAQMAGAAIPGVFIIQQRRVRRCIGAEASREVFSTARKSPFASPQLYLASAALEFYANGRDMSVPRNILEAGRKRYPTSVDFLLSASDFLILHDDCESARDFVESIIQSAPPSVAPSSVAIAGKRSGQLKKQKQQQLNEQQCLNPSATRPFWDRLIALELTLSIGGGKLDTVRDLERRRGESHPHLVGSETRLLQRICHRWAVCEDGLPPVTEYDLNFLKRHPCGPLDDIPAHRFTGGDDSERVEIKEGLFLQVPKLLGVSPLTSHRYVPGQGTVPSEKTPVYKSPQDPSPSHQEPPSSSRPSLEAHVDLSTHTVTPKEPISVPSYPSPTFPNASVEVSPLLLPFLVSLPALAPSLGPIPDVTKVLQALCDWEPPTEISETTTEDIGSMDSGNKRIKIDC